MASITIIGTGKMSKALQTLFERSRSQVQVINHKESTKTPVEGDIVVLAVPYTALFDIVAKLGDELSDKVVVDICNPVDAASFTLIRPEAGSAAAEYAAALPGAHVVKAFNTNFAATLASGSVASAPISVLIAGYDAEAKKALSDVVTASGAAAYDVGGLARAAELEALGFLQIALAASGQIGWTNGFALYQ